VAAGSPGPAYRKVTFVGEVRDDGPGSDGVAILMLVVMVAISESAPS
jgi:hypothetical protein